MSEPWTVDAPAWEQAQPIPAIGVFADRGTRYADKFWTRDGWVYKAVGDLHPENGVLAVPDWAPVRDAPHVDLSQRDGLVKVRDHRWPDSTPVRPRLPLVDVPLYGRRFELLRPIDITTEVLPEQEAGRIVEAPEPGREQLVADLLVSLSGAAGIALGQLGLNGSYSLRLSAEQSDVDLDVYGAEAVSAATRAIDHLLADPTSGWERRWPPDEQTNLHYVWRAAYPGIRADTMYAAFETSRRDRFNLRYRGVRVSLSYHSRARTERFPDAPLVGRPPVDAKRLHAVFVEEGPPGHLDLPAIFTVREVASESGPRWETATVVSYSKAFGFCRHGDRVAFTACPTTCANGGLLLVIPSYGPRWPVRPLAVLE
ncbi:hypothetical protein OG381_00475 [Streptomyces sp. NBC_00490]|uniref:hypothetical protein n=1 Tax=Streptomyces sp. NBC_00490 TaxID=2903657 RepID=UPI002E18A948